MKTTLKLALLLFVMGGFIASCSSAPEGEKAETTEAQEKTEETKTEEAEAASFNVSTENSLIKWVGSKTGGKHDGTLSLQEGMLKVKDGKLVGGTFTIDMASINVTDLEGGDKADLEKHLKDGDFFEVESYPTATFEITEVKEGADVEGATHTITGNLTLKEIPKSVTFPATITMEEGKVMASTPSFNINRKDWGVNFEISAKDVALNEEMGIQIDLTAMK